MTAIATLLANLLRPGVTEVQLVTGRRPTAVIGSELHVIGDATLASDELIQLLFGAGGSRYVESLGTKPAHWRTRVDGVGAVAVSAALHGDTIEARFILRGPQSLAPGGAAPTTPPTATTSKPTTVPAPNAALAPTPVAPPPPPVSSAPSGAGIRGPKLFGPGFNMGRGRLSSDSASTRPTQPMMERVDIDALERQGDAVQADVGPMVVELDLPPSFPTPPGPVFDTESGPLGPRIPLPPTLPNLRAQTGAPAIRLRALLETARALGASDLHVAAGRTPLARVAGKLTEQGQTLEAGELEAALVQRLSPSALAAFEGTGSCRITIDEAECGRFRVVLARHRAGLTAAFRPIPLVTPSLASLGLGAAAAAVSELARRLDGFVLVSSPAGEGRSTTLAAIVDVINSEVACSIVTLEDPIEHLYHRGRALVSQREIGPHARDKRSGLEVAIADAAEVIVAGDLREAEDAAAAALALSAAVRGHLVLATTTAPTAASAIARLVELLPAAERRRALEVIASTLRLVIAQRGMPDVSGAGVVVVPEILLPSPALRHFLREGKTTQIGSLVSGPEPLPSAARPTTSVPPPPTGPTTRPPSMRPPSMRPPDASTVPRGGLLDRVFKKGG